MNQSLKGTKFGGPHRGDHVKWVLLVNRIPESRLPPSYLRCRIQHW